LNQFPSVDAQASLEADARENRFVSAKNGQRPDRRQRDRGVLGEGLHGLIGQEKFPRIKSVRREPGSQRVSQEASAFQANDIGATSQGILVWNLGSGYICTVCFQVESCLIEMWMMEIKTIEDYMLSNTWHFLA
jgi:hypothetical protein